MPLANSQPARISVWSPNAVHAHIVNANIDTQRAILRAHVLYPKWIIHIARVSKSVVVVDANGTGRTRWNDHRSRGRTTYRRREASDEERDDCEECSSAAYGASLTPEPMTYSIRYLYTFVYRFLVEVDFKINKGTIVRAIRVRLTEDPTLIRGWTTSLLSARTRFRSHPSE